MIEKEIKTGGMKYMIDLNETINKSEKLIEKGIVGRLSLISWEIEKGEVPF